MKTIKDVIVFDEKEIKEAIISQLYKRKPELRPLGTDIKQPDPIVEFIIGSKNGIQVHISDADTLCEG